MSNNGQIFMSKGDNKIKMCQLPTQITILLIFIKTRLINLMQNPLLKNRRTGLHDDATHRTSHYNRVLGAKSFYKTRQPAQKSFLDSLNSKRFHSLEEERKMGNKKLLLSIIQIENSPKNFTKCEYKSPKSLKSHFVQKEGMNKIMEENRYLYKKILQASPEVGSLKEWKHQYKKMKHYGNLKYNNRTAYNQLDDKFYHTFKKLRTKKNKQAFIKLQKNFNNRITQRNLQNGSPLLQQGNL